MMPDIHVLQISLKHWDWFSYAATGVVLVGVIGEFLVEFTNWPRHNKLKSGLGKIAALLLILGIGGEIVGQARTAQESGQIVAVLNREAAEADRSASDADVRAAKAYQNAALAERQAKKFQAEAERERLARLKIEKTLAPRSLSKSQRQLLTSKLRKFAGTPFDLSAHPDPETENLLSSLQRILLSAGWIEKPFVNLDPIYNRTFRMRNGAVVGIADYSWGVTVYIAPGDFARFGPAVATLVSGLEGDGMATVATTSQRTGSGVVHITVGTKP